MKFYALWLSAICILFFILQIAIPGFTDALVLNQQSFIEPWRFVTAIFLHGDITHLIYNLFALVLFGLILEKLIGSRKFLIVFIFSGIFANLISVNFYDSSLGASGAIFGIIGALAVARPLMTVWAFGLPMPMFIAAILWAAGDVIGIFAPSGIANIAHLSGIAVGIIIAIFIKIMKPRKKSGFSYTHKINIPEPQIRNWEDENM